MLYLSSLFNEHSESNPDCSFHASIASYASGRSYHQNLFITKALCALQQCSKNPFKSCVRLYILSQNHHHNLMKSNQFSRAPDKVRIFISIMHISSTNPIFDHLIESSHRDDSNKWSNIGFGGEITLAESIEVYFTQLIWSPGSDNVGNLAFIMITTILKS